LQVLDLLKTLVLLLFELLLLLLKLSLKFECILFLIINFASFFSVLQDEDAVHEV